MLLLKTAASRQQVVISQSCHPAMAPSSTHTYDRKCVCVCVCVGPYCCCFCCLYCAQRGLQWLLTEHSTAGRQELLTSSRSVFLNSLPPFVPPCFPA